ncbi:MAG: chemotaxis protein CheW [Planctomycetales bacterium]|nr:chemotaxis protein CheW [Planctomycetales bacterium]
MNAEKHCVFDSGTQWYAVPALSVRYVTTTPQLFHVPETDSSVAGLCHLRSEFLAAVHLDRLAGVESTDDAPPQLISIAGVHGAWGLLVSDVRDLCSLDSTTADTERRGFGSCVVGAATHEGRFVRLLDPNRLYKLVEERLRSAWSSLASAKNTLSPC